MNCRNCPDRDICYKFSIAAGNAHDFAKLKEAYLRTLKCRIQRFGR